MAERPTLTLPCFTMPDDKVVLTHYGRLIVLVATDDENRTEIDLSQDTARELFNWLGVQLHKGGWDP